MDAIRFDMRDVERGLSRLEAKQVPFASVMALNATAQDVLTDLQGRMDVSFDRPTRFTKNAFMVWRATKATMEAAVQERPSVGKRHYLKVGEFGGARGQTGLEKMLSSTLAYSGDLRAVMPASGAKIDSFGNWSSGERNQAISAVKGFRQAGYNANQTEASRKRNAGKRASYFTPRAGSKLGAGIYKRDSQGAISKVLTFASSVPVYQKRLGFQDGAEQVIKDKMAANFAEAFAKAMATAR